MCAITLQVGKCTASIYLLGLHNTFSCIQFMNPWMLVVKRMVNIEVYLLSFLFFRKQLLNWNHKRPDIRSCYTKANYTKSYKAVSGFHTSGKETWLGGTASVSILTWKHLFRSINVVPSALGKRRLTVIVNPAGIRPANQPNSYEDTLCIMYFQPPLSNASLSVPFDTFGCVVTAVYRPQVRTCILNYSCYGAERGLCDWKWPLFCCASFQHVLRSLVRKWRRRTEAKTADHAQQCVFAARKRSLYRARQRGHVILVAVTANNNHLG